MLVASVHHQPSSVLLNFETLSSNSFDKSVSDKGQNLCWKVSVDFTSRKTFPLNLVPTTVSKNIFYLFIYLLIKKINYKYLLF